MHTGKVTLRDYDFEQPSLQLEASVAGKQPEEHYAYPGRYTSLDDGDRFARLLLEAEEARQHVARGAGTCRTFQTGYRFDLKDHYSKDVNQTYMLLDVRHTGRAGDYRTWESAPFDYRNDFTVIPLFRALPAPPAGAQASDLGDADRARGREEGGGDLDGQAGAGEGAVLLGPGRARRTRTARAGCGCRARGRARGGVACTSRASGRK